MEEPLRLRLTLDPRDHCWELPLRSLAGTFVGLIGWMMSERQVDAGVPVTVQQILTSALCAHWRISFPDSRDDAKPGKLVHLTTTSDPETARQMFDQIEFSWTNRAQFGILHTLASLPVMDERAVRKSLSNNGSAREFMKDSGIAGIVLPGVDGDFAAISLLDNQWKLLATTLQEECSRRGVAWDIISETEFRQSSWYTDGTQPIGGAKQL